jgi:hypothetical protein
LKIGNGCAFADKCHQCVAVGQQKGNSHTSVLNTYSVGTM